MFQKTDHIACPINSGHKIPLASVDKHVQKCCLKSSGYELNAEFLSEPNSSESSITLGIFFIYNLKCFSEIFIFRYFKKN